MVVGTIIEIRLVGVVTAAQVVAHVGHVAHCWHVTQVGQDGQSGHVGQNCLRFCNPIRLENAPNSLPVAGLVSTMS